LYDALAASGFNEIVATAPVDVDVTKAVTAVGDGFVFAGNSAADQVTLSGDAATIEALSTTDIAAVGRAIRENPGSETLLKANDGPVKIPTDQADVFVARAVRLNAPGAHNVQLLSAKAQITGFAAADIDTFSNAGFNAFESTDGAFGVGAGAAIAASTDGILFGAGPGGVVSVSDLAANVEAMTPAQLDQLNNEGITAIVATDGPLIFDAAQAAALLDPVTVSVPAGDDITLTDTAAHVEGLSPDQIAGLPGIGFHGIAVTDTSLAFDVGQALAFLSSGLVVGVPLGDGLFVSDTQANLDGLNPSQAAGLQNAGFLTEVACFAAGTSVATADGPVAVEDLAIGDRVVTIDGTPEPVVWIGSREVDCRRHPHPETVWPVRVRAGAFGENVPVRDLYLSPDHAIFVNGVLVPVKLLIDGSSIVQVRRSAIAYYHVELPRHAVILAEGLTVESFLDTGDKANFLRDGETVRLFPDFAARFGPQTARVWETLGAARLITSGPELTAARQRVKNPCPATMANRRLRT